MSSRPATATIGSTAATGSPRAAALGMAGKHGLLTAVGRVGHAFRCLALAHIELAVRPVLARRQGGEQLRGGIRVGRGRSGSSCDSRGAQLSMSCRQASAAPSFTAPTDKHAMRPWRGPTMQGVGDSRRGLSVSMLSSRGQQGWPGPPQSVPTLGAVRHLEPARRCSMGMPLGSAQSAGIAGS